MKAANGKHLDFINESMGFPWLSVLSLIKLVMLWAVPTAGWIQNETKAGGESASYAPAGNYSPQIGHRFSL